MSVQVSSQPGQPTHHIQLSGGGETWGALLENGPRGITEQPVQASTLVQVTRASRYGSGEPGQIEQRNWTGGRAQENFFDDDSRFYDGQNLWTLSDDMLLNGPQWSLVRSTSAPGDRSLPGSVEWRQLLGAERYLSVATTPLATLSSVAAYLHIRRRGRPGTLTVEVRDNNAGVPGSVLKSATATVSNVTDVVSEFYGFDWSAAQSLTGGTPYWVVIYGASTDNQANHWEVGTLSGGADGKKAAVDGTWSTTTYPPYFYLSTTKGPETTELVWQYFELEGAWYGVSRVAANTGIDATSTLRMQGDRGMCDSNAANKDRVVDATKNWTVNQWVGAKVKIIAGPGLGEWHTIESNTATYVATNTATPFSTTQTTSSRYVIYDTPIWQSLPMTGDDAIPASFTVTDVEVVNAIAFFACGSNPIRQFRNSSSDGLHDFDTTETQTARLLHLFYHPDDGPQVWRVGYLNGAISRSTPATWGGVFGFGSAITVGDTGKAITSLLSYDDELWVVKTDSLWRVKNDRPARLDVGLEAMDQPTNGLAVAAQNLFLFFNYAQSVERLYGQTLDDMGPWKGAGLPSGRAGPVSALLPVLGWLFAAVDGGLTGVSCILVWNGIGWSEIFRGWEVGRRIRSLAWVAVPGGQPKLYFSFGSLMLYLTFPQDGLHPLRDTAMPYAHESVLVSSTIDLGTVRLPKFYKEFEAVVDGFRRLTAVSKGKEIWLDVQFDDNIGTANWITLGVLEHAPVDQVQIGQGQRRAMRYRLRINTNEATVPVVVRGAILEAYARTPVKYQYHLRLRTSSLQRTLLGQQDSDPDEFIAWLKWASASASPVRVRSMFKQWDDRLVIIEPPTILRKWQNTILSWMGASITVTVRDA